MLTGVRRAIMAQSVRANAQVVNNAPMKDQDRIFTNIYGFHDFKLKGEYTFSRQPHGPDLGNLNDDLERIF